MSQPVVCNNFSGGICYASFHDFVGVQRPRADNFDGGDFGIDERSSKDKGGLKGHGIAGSFITTSECCIEAMMGPKTWKCKPNILCFNAEAKSEVALLTPCMPSFLRARIMAAQSMMWAFTSSIMTGANINFVPSGIKKLFSDTSVCNADLIFWLCNTNCLQPLEISGYHSFSSEHKCPGLTCF